MLAKIDYTAHAAAMDPEAPGPAMTEPSSSALVKLAKSGYPVKIAHTI